MYKLVFIDIDGTLLTSHDKISPKTLASIKRISLTNKILVILTTARPPQAVIDFYSSLNLNSPVVCFNGALILKDLGAGKGLTVLNSICIGPEFLETIYASVAQYNINISFYHSGDWMSDRSDEWIFNEENITGTKVCITNLSKKIKNWIAAHHGPHKILLMGEPNELDAVSEMLKIKTNHQLSIYKSKPTYLEIMNIAASKRNAIEFFQTQYKVTANEIIAIGDNFNDSEMIKLAGLGIAMGNAPDEVKAFANYITLDNDSDGISIALDKFIP